MNLEKILPPRLNKGQSIGIIAPADPVAGVCSNDRIQQGCSYFKSKGFSVIIGESAKILTEKYTAGSIDLRAKDIHNFIKRKNIGCIMAFWGGFNSNQLLDYLDYDLIKNNPKIFIGYSDVTALTTAITTKTGLITFSGPGMVSFTKPEPFDYTWEYFDKTCINPTEELKIKTSSVYADDFYFLRPDNNHRIKKKNKGLKIINHGKADGEILAGNLSTLLLLNNTEYLPDLNNKILFLEEDETTTPAHFDRYLMQCQHLGWWKKISGLVFGRFTEQSGFSIANPLEDTLNQYFSKVDFPVLYNADFGHSDPMFTIPNGGGARVNTKQKEITFIKSVS